MMNEAINNSPIMMDRQQIQHCNKHAPPQQQPVPPTNRFVATPLIQPLPPLPGEAPPIALVGIPTTHSTTNPHNPHNKRSLPDHHNHHGHAPIFSDLMNGTGTATTTITTTTTAHAGGPRKKKKGDGDSNTAIPIFVQSKC